MEDMCDKNSCEAGTEKVDEFNTMVAMPLEAVFFMIYNHSIGAMLEFFSSLEFVLTCLGFVLNAEFKLRSSNSS